MKTKTSVSANIIDNQMYMNKKLGIDISYDVDYREIYILETKLQIYFVSGLCDTSVIQQLMREIVGINDHESESDKAEAILITD